MYLTVTKLGWLFDIDIMGQLLCLAWFKILTEESKLIWPVGSRSKDSCCLMIWLQYLSWVWIYLGHKGPDWTICTIVPMWWWACNSCLLVHIHRGMMMSILQFISNKQTTCAGPLTLLYFMEKLAFRKIWIIILAFSNRSSAVWSHTVMSLMYCRCSGASLLF